MIDFGTFRLIREDPDGRIEISFCGDACIDDLLGHVEDFMQACGFHFAGHITISQD